jgi:hypothetical protein
MESLVRAKEKRILDKYKKIGKEKIKDYPFWCIRKLINPGLSQRKKKNMKRVPQNVQSNTNKSVHVQQEYICIQRCLYTPERYTNRDRSLAM